MKYTYIIIVALLSIMTPYAEDSIAEREKLDNLNIDHLSAELNALKKEVEVLSSELNQSKMAAEEKSKELINAISSLRSGDQTILLKLQDGTEARDYLEQGLLDLKNEVSILDNSIEKISLAWSQSSSLTKIGALVLLIGLLFEIIGAIVLAGTHLVMEQKDVFTLKSTPPSNDLSTTDINFEPRIGFLGSVASAMLFSGFVMQFSGTILVFSLPFWLSSLFVTIAIIPGSGIIYYLLGQSYNQTRSQKLKIILKNIRRNLFPVFGAKCSICSKKLNFDNAYVFWISEPNSEAHPYLYSPYHMHLGHRDCLSSSGKYQKDTRNNSIEPHEYFVEIHKSTVKDFITQEAPKMKKWWDEYRNHWTERRGEDKNISYSEYTFNQVLNSVVTR